MTIPFKIETIGLIIAHELDHLSEDFLSSLEQAVDFKLSYGDTVYEVETALYDPASKTIRVTFEGQDE